MQPNVLAGLRWSRGPNHGRPSVRRAYCLRNQASLEQFHGGRDLSSNAKITYWSYGPGKRTFDSQRNQIALDS